MGGRAEKKLRYCSSNSFACRSRPKARLSGSTNAFTEAAMVDEASILFLERKLKKTRLS